MQGIFKQQLLETVREIRSNRCDSNQLLFMDQDASRGASDNSSGVLATQLASLDEDYEMLAIIQSRSRQSPEFAAYVEEQMAANRARRNRLVPFYRLPDDIYFTILETLRDAPSFRMKDALTVSQVSKLWREFALSLPRLWTLIDNESVSTRSIPSFISRSKGAFLEISYNHTQVRRHARSTYPYCEPEPEFREFITPTLPHIARCRTLSILDVPMDVFLPRFLAPAPELKTLVLSGYSSRALDLERDACSLFSGSVPRLRSMTLRGVYLPLNPALYGGITRLYVSDTPFPTVQIILRILELTELLEEFMLESPQFPSNTLSVSDSRHSIHLPHLRSISLKKMAHSTIRCITTSIHALKSLSYLEVIPDGNNVHVDHADADLTRILTSTAQPDPGASILSRIGYLYVIGFARDSAGLAVTGHIGSPREQHVLKLEVRTRLWYKELFRSIGDLHPFPSLRALSLHNLSDHKLDIPSFVYVLRKLAQIEQLTLDSCSLPFIEAITIDPHNSVLPHLKLLRIRNSVIAERTLISLVHSRTALTEDPAYARITRLQTLILLRCEVDVCIVVKLMGFMDDVRWDGSHHALCESCQNGTICPVERKKMAVAHATSHHYLLGMASNV
ncbi:hypothetical protein BOTBODRAFT_496909 [Botryobasidium botryosum FD-172 SS1]|uniref:Uncharacterized protein n=1 Tax=Botryobasidium botryosum (strain FD-172 SS1) TaxID=930990 RepID=A0A067M6B5_BOTB1|nr:hypothetical protein BOTBODRAFT_496909 [Botryobasidium botryosum FD-172 SS1]